MAYVDRQPLSQRLANLGTAGLIELAIGATLIGALSFTGTIPRPVPTTEATPIPIPLPPTPEPTPTPRPTDFPTARPTGSILDPLPTPLATPIGYPTPTITGTDEGGGTDPRPRATPTSYFTPVAASPRNAPSGWVTTDDYPARDLREGNQGVTRFRVTVGTDGRVQRCEILRSSGFPSLDDTACAKITRRARFDPAIGENGAKVVGSYASSVRWQIP